MNSSILMSLYFLVDIATVVGYLAVSAPFLDLSHPRHMHSTHNEILTVSILVVY